MLMGAGRQSNGRKSRRSEDAAQPIAETLGKASRVDCSISRASSSGGCTVTPDEFKEILRQQVESRKSGEGLQVESFLERFPSLAEDRDHLIALILSERDLARERGRSIEGQLLNRFPQFSDELKEIIRFEEPVLQGFEIEGDVPAGSGGTAVVWKARDGLGQEVAIKVVHRWACQNDKYFELALRRGISSQTSSTLTSRGCVKS